MLLPGHANRSYICAVTREEVSKPSRCSGAAKPRSLVPILQLRPCIISPPDALSPAASVASSFPVSLAMQNGIQDTSRLCHTGRSYFKAFLFCSRTAWALLRCHYLSHFSWLAPVAYSPFSEQRIFKSPSQEHLSSCTPADSHGMEHLRRHLRARGDGRLRQEDFPSWTSLTGLQVLQQTAGLSGLHEGAFEHSRFRAR